MKIHFFQRYHSKENVDTANTMLLLSRLYSFSSTKFFSFLAKVLPEKASVELIFNLQEKSESSIPDATITQASFKIVVETKLYGNFELGQLKSHLLSFKGEDYRVLLTLDPRPMSQKIKAGLAKAISEYINETKNYIIHQHLTFEDLVKAIEEVIDERDYEMKDVLEDYKEYCYSGGLMTDDWKRMRVQLAGTTIAINKQLNVYYDNIERGFSGHQYLGLYNQKAVRAIGKISAIVTAAPKGNTLDIEVEKGNMTEEMNGLIVAAIEDAKNYGYNLLVKQRYFFVEKFYDTFYEKTTPRAPMGSRIFDLCDVLGVKELPSTKEIAELLRQRQWV